MSEFFGDVCQNLFRREDRIAAMSIAFAAAAPGSLPASPSDFLFPPETEYIYRPGMDIDSVIAIIAVIIKDHQCRNRLLACRNSTVRCLQQASPRTLLLFRGYRNRRFLSPFASFSFLFLRARCRSQRAASSCHERLIAALGLVGGLLSQDCKTNVHRLNSMSLPRYSCAIRNHL